MPQLTRWSPQSEFDTLRNQMERMMRDTERLFSSFLPTVSPRSALASTRQEREMNWMPTCDVHIKGNDLMLNCELPGIDPKDVEVNTTQDSITISGEHKEEHEFKDTDCCLHERMLGRFFRQVMLPDTIEPDKAKATFKNGLLTITAPLAEGTKRRAHKVAIEAGGR